MSRVRRKFTSEFKAKVALAAIREDATLTELSSRFGVHGNMINRWKKEALAGMEDTFSGKSEKAHQTRDEEVKELHAKIGQLTIEKDFLENASRRLGLGGVKKW